MIKKKLTQRETEVYLFICAYRAQYGFSPSMRDICKGCYLASTRSAHLYIDILQRKGYIKFIPRIPRSITLTDREAI